jgi:hypothetical protein
VTINGCMLADYPFLQSCLVLCCLFIWTDTPTNNVWGAELTEHSVYYTVWWECCGGPGGVDIWQLTRGLRVCVVSELQVLSIWCVTASHIQTPGSQLCLSLPPSLSLSLVNIHSHSPLTHRQHNTYSINKQQQILVRSAHAYSFLTDHPGLHSRYF